MNKPIAIQFTEEDKTIAPKTSDFIKSPEWSTFMYVDDVTQKRRAAWVKYDGANPKEFHHITQFNLMSFTQYIKHKESGLDEIEARTYTRENMAMAFTAGVQWCKGYRTSTDFETFIKTI